MENWKMPYIDSYSFRVFYGIDWSVYLEEMFYITGSLTEQLHFLIMQLITLTQQRYLLFTPNREKGGQHDTDKQNLQFNNC